MRFNKFLVFIALIGLMLGACSAAPKEINNVQETLEALSVQATIDRGISQTLQASDAGDTGNDEPSLPDESALGDGLDRTACNSYTTLELAEQEVVRLLNTQDYAPLAEGILTEQFSVGVWMSEGRGFTANEFAQEMATSLTPGRNAPFTITFDLAQFPLMDGAGEWIDMFGADSVSVAYSTGWGDTGTHEAMLYFKQDECGGFVWYRMMYSYIGFSPVALGPPPVAPNCSSYISILDFETALIDALDVRDFNHLINNGMLDDPSGIGYYLSEGREYTPNELVEQLSLNLLPANGAVFNATNDSTQFPPDGGYPWFDWMGADSIAMIYTTGWGDNGNGEAFLYLKEDSCGGIIWHATLYSGFGFP